MKIKFVLLLALILQTCYLVAQTSYLDSTFNASGPTKGKKLIDFGVSEEASAVAVDEEGRPILVVNDVEGTAIYVTRLRTNGDPDLTFATSGVFSNVHTEPQKATCILRQPDRKILIGGSRSDGNNGDLPMVMRLNSDGTLDGSFGSGGVATIDFQLGPGYEQISKMVLQSDGQIIIMGTKTNGIFVARLRPNGVLDNAYNSPLGYRYETVIESYNTGLDINSSDNVLVSVNCGAGAYNVHLFMLKPNGTRDLSYNFIGKDSLNLSGQNICGVVFQPDGKYILGSNDNSYYYARRYTPGGEADTTFGNYGEARSASMYGVNGKNIMLDSKGKIIIVGTYNYYGYAAVRFDSEGQIDASFANNGVYAEYSQSTGLCTNGCLTPDNKVFLVGEETSSAMIEKIENRQVMHILGDDYVLPGTSELYEVKVPSAWTYTYAWEFTGGDYFFVPDSIGQKVMILFDEDATDGELICRGYTGLTPYVMAKMKIKINNNATQANLLAEVQCTKEVTDCYNNYISHFKLNLISNDSSTCNSTGYSDFTRSQWVDTLIAGSVYSASVRAESDEPLKYAALWIDYNNDGAFDSTSEFVTQVYGPGPILNLQNIILKNKEGYSGPKRLRVRCSPVGFTSGQACAESGESGETEDYMIIIKEQDKLEAPEIITPNEDGKNDYFVIRGVDPEFGNSISIFDRYGEEVFSADNYENNWDGKSKNGGKVTPGTYYYYFKNNENYIRGFVEVRY